MLKRWLRRRQVDKEHSSQIKSLEERIEKLELDMSQAFMVMRSFSRIYQNDRTLDLKQFDISFHDFTVDESDLPY